MISLNQFKTERRRIKQQREVVEGVFKYDWGYLNII